ncbi:MAG: hypothetical protein KC910_03020 [Candidatus Eremiobacteraeota bacterium]|nr:hypothetical protein [Candidatus Eremiobacteraeota bacterium]
MKSFLRSLATLTILGALVTGTGYKVARAQEEGDASGKVTISEDAETPKTPDKPAKAEQQGPKKMPKPKLTDRDPFINPIEAGTFSGGKTPKKGDPNAGPTVRAHDGEGATANADAKGGDEAAYTDEEVEEIDPPAVTISGIVSSGGGRMAILTSPDQSHIVRVGDKVGEYRVAGISERAVTFKIKDQTFKIIMEDEFGLSSK